MNNNRNSNNRQNGSGQFSKAKIIKLVIIIAVFAIMLIVTGNYKSFLPFIDWGDTESSSLVGTEIFPGTEDQYEDEENSNAVWDTPPEESVPTDTTAPPETTPAPETTLAPETTTAPPETEPVATEPEDDVVEISYYFRNKSTYDSHYEKHKDEFGDITQEDYLRMANELIFSDADTVLTKYEDDGDFMYFDTATGYFLVLAPDDYIRTFFVPTDGIDYWNRQ